MTAISTPTPTNSSAATGVSVVTGVTNTGITIGENLLFADYPFLAVPGLKQLISLAVNFLAGYIIKGLSQLVVFSIIDVQVGGEESDFNTALAALKAAQASGDANAIQQALTNFQAAAQNLGHSDGSASV